MTILISLIVAAVFTTGAIIFALTLCTILIKRMCASKMDAEEDHNPQPIYEDITQNEILMDENAAYSQFAPKNCHPVPITSW